MSEILKETFNLLIDEVKKNEEKANAVFEAISSSGEGLAVNNDIRHFHFRIDEPQGIGGQDSGANPVEHLLAALGSCQVITYKAVAALNNIRLDKVTVKTKGDLDLRGFLGVDETIRPGYQKIVFETILESEEEPEKLYQLSKQVEKLCPVLDILSNPVTVKGKVTIKRIPQEALNLN